jgi:hypothetical protein
MRKRADFSVGDFEAQEVTRAIGVFIRHYFSLDLLQPPETGWA